MRWPSAASHSKNSQPRASARVPFEELAAADDFGPRLGERLALLAGDGERDLVDALAHQRGCLEQHVGPPARRDPGQTASPSAAAASAWSSSACVASGTAPIML